MAAPLTSRPEPIPGYRLIERLGRGGFGEVWKCEAPGGILKAIKFVYGDLEDAGDEGKPAAQEFKALKRVKQVRHPYILSLEQIQEVEGQLLIVMELADRNLWDRFRECRSQGLPGIPRDELLGYVTEAAEALDLMNQEYNLQHLDIKPQNLFLIHRHVKVADFGLVKDLEGVSASVTGGVTPVYAAPETFDGRVTRFSDQYSLAIVYQELLTGVRPFNGNTTRQLILQHMTQAPDLAPLPEGDRAVVGRALAKKGDERFPSCTAFAQALQRAGAGLTPPDRPPGADTPVTGPAGGHDAHSALPSGLHSRLLASRPSELISRRDPSRRDPADTQCLGPAPATMLRPLLIHSVPIEQLPVAPPEQTGDGALLPAVVIGVGHVGGLVVRRLRKAVGERFGADAPGAAAALPHLRLITLDTDPGAGRGNSSDSQRPTPRDHLLARLHRPSHYLNKGRDSGVPVESWLEPSLVYRLPRNPLTEGRRGLGRLAFWDNFRPIEQRLRAELTACLDPAALAEADRLTGLGLRSNRPRVYIVASLAGGTGSGMFLDLAYLARHLLRKLGYTKPEVVGVLLLPGAPGAADRPAAKSQAVANAYAALTELSHYSRPGTKYELKVSAREPPILDDGRPFARCLCLPLVPGADAPVDTRTGNHRPAAGLAAAVLFRELLSPVGRAADTARGAAADGEAFCRTAAAYRFASPRRRLLRRTGLRLGEYLLQLWTAKEPGPLRAAVQAWLDEQWDARQLRPEQVIDRIQEACWAALGQSPDAKFDALIDSLAQSGALGSQLDARSVCQVLDKVAGLVGRPPSPGQDAEPPALLQRSVADDVRALSAEYEQRLAEMAIYFIELPQYRLAAAEEAIRQLTDRLQQVLDTYEDLHKALTREAADLYAQLFPMIRALENPGSAGRRAPSAAEALELLRAYPKKRYQALVSGYVLAVYRGMLNAAPEYLREVNFCRQRLGEVLAAVTAAATADAARSPALGPGLDLFPGGGRTLDEAATALAEALSPEQWLELDNRVQHQVRRQFKAVVNYCLESHGHVGPLVDVICQQAEEYLAECLGESGPADVFFQHFAEDPQAAHRAVAHGYDEATPELTEGTAGPGAEVAVLAAPPTPAGEKFRVLAGEAVPGVSFIPAVSPDDLVIYRERYGLALTDLPQLGPAARDAYKQALDSDEPPHTRTDVRWQAPPGR